MFVRVFVKENISITHTCAQITCLYDMDIVFQPSGNFDEVYLYVSKLWKR
jgi:hypothetical protein